MNDMTFVVAENLKFNMMGILNEFLDVNIRIAESLLGLRSCRMVTFDQRNIIVRHTHSASATAGRRFDQHGVANAFWQ